MIDIEAAAKAAWEKYCDLLEHDGCDDDRSLRDGYIDGYQDGHDAAIARPATAPSPAGEAREVAEKEAASIIQNAQEHGFVLDGVAAAILRGAITTALSAAERRGIERAAEVANALSDLTVYLAANDVDGLTQHGEPFIAAREALARYRALTKE